MKDKIEPYTKEKFEEIKAKLTDAGYTTKTKWRKGLKTISLEPIILEYRKDVE